MANVRIPELNSDNISYQSWGKSLANELRIGNIVLWENEEGQYWPMPIESGSEIDNAHKYKGIPLTPEILEKCGYKEYVDHSGNFYSHNGSYKYYLHKQVFVIFEEMGSKGSHYILNFKHLHQLQNLYFALTGEELQINL